MNEEIKLGDCPFCGEHNLEVESEERLWRVLCLECYGSSAWYFSEKGAIALWNRRAVQLYKIN